MKALAAAIALLGLTALPAQAAPPNPLAHQPSNALQAVTVAASAGATSATLSGWARSAPGGTWHRVLGPETARVGYRGIAATGAKREGDGRTPSGIYPFTFAFGVRANPGVHYPWRQVTGRYDVWDDDPASPRYNQWVDTRRASAGRAPEPLDVTPVYNAALVIDYNSLRKPGYGSGIFLHVTNGHATSGCVSLPSSQLVAVLRWLQPSKHPVISIVRG
jgi:L,D-peptidoglycan transpeptidase YkuD (ErfK/YbiS/YcfS/YnhG family)